MDDVRIYRIRIGGQVVESEIASFSPPDWRIKSAGQGSSILIVKTDQSGLIGLIRQLPGLGFELLSFHCE